VINKAVLGGIGVVILLIILIVGSFFIGPQLVDIFLILAALVSLVAFALLGYAALQVVGLVKEVRGEVKILMNTAQETLAEVQGTAHFVQGTARFVSENVVSPVAQAAGFVTATRATVKSFTEPLYKRRG
jgi:hypothetical protein